MSNIFELKAGKPERVKSYEALRKFADLLEEMEELYGDVEVAGVALIPEIGVALCGNSETGNDGLMTMLEIGKTAIVMQYIGEEEDVDETFH
jgi:hypothetical protein